MKLLESKRLTIALEIAIAISIAILVNSLGSFFFVRLDLTEENRYSISPATKELLENLEDDIYIEAYLEGELPAAFKRMRGALEETLTEFSIYSNGKIQFQFINPDQAVSQKSRNQFIMSLARKGIQPTDVFLTEEGKRIQKRIMPGVVISYGSAEKGVQLFKGNKAASPEERLNQSIEGIEYELANAIQDIIGLNLPSLGIIRGHNELDSANFISLHQALDKRYLLKIIDLTSVDKIPTVDAILLAKPTTRFSSTDKYKLDQYLMNGGTGLFLLDKVAVNMDSANVGTFSFPYDLDLDDQLFTYGVRINNDLVQDFVSGTYPIVVGNEGEQAKIQLLQWPYFPVINEYSKHSTVRNLDATLTRFASSIDTVKAAGVKKTLLFSSSPYARKLMSPTLVDLNLMQQALDPAKFTTKNIPMGYLLEGRFTSFFKNKFLPEGQSKKHFKPEGGTKLIIISDGDLARNDLDPKTGQPLPLGYDPFTNQTFANQDLILNLLTYLTRGNGLITARSKQVLIRPLDKVKLKNGKLVWQLINVALPVVLLILFGIAYNWVRRRKYTRF
ncbi:MAG: gliding motility-associated ABC transporter substrate-binding protein GldG [Cyclobacteriaceae bacterium]|nr:gliding motility-associated ABC transporter substrate-binding protein GldG [Cyclobacteriaceae bacterium]